jgi:hypothetical protein
METLRVAETVVNPEAMINAAVAAANAQTAAYWAAILAVLTLGAVLVMGLMVGFMAYKFREMVVHTNGMLKSLLDLTDKISRAEGVATGRQAQKDEDAMTGLKA